MAVVGHLIRILIRILEHNFQAKALPHQGRALFYHSPRLQARPRPMRVPKVPPGTTDRFFFSFHVVFHIVFTRAPGRSQACKSVPGLAEPQDGVCRPSTKAFSLGVGGLSFSWTLGSQHKAQEHEGGDVSKEMTILSKFGISVLVQNS